MDEQKKAPRYYPLFLTMEGRTCLVVGGGSVGERKIKNLLKYGAIVRLVAREISQWLNEKCSEKAITWVAGNYESSQLDGVTLVFAATSDNDLNRRIAEDARSLGIWCNMATEPELGSFIVPSVVERGPLNVAISTSGFSPAVSRQLRRKFEKDIGPEWEFFVRFLGELRELFKSRNILDKKTQELFSQLAALPVAEWMREGRAEKAFKKISELCEPFISKSELQPVWDGLWNRFSS